MMEKLYLVARIADTRVALRSRTIHSVVTVGQPVEVPGAPPHVAGLFALRSRVFTLIDPHVVVGLPPVPVARSEEHTSELQSLMRISYAVFCLKKKTKNNINIQ